ncbi:hypothetical protein FQZ97_967840 [compost metagenome]
MAARLADLATRLEAARLLCIRAYSMMDADVRCQMQASMAQCFATEMALDTCRTALLHERPATGADVERLLREIIALPGAGCGSDHQKLLIARELTGIGALD